MSCTAVKPNLLGFAPKKLEDFLLGLGHPSYRARQLLQWLHQRQQLDWHLMSDFSVSLRAQLAELSCLQLPSIVKEEVATDGTYKWLVAVSGGNIVETVFIPGPTRGTLCISSQAGCVLNCSFCHTGRQGFSYNLSTAEIIGQLWLAKQRLATLPEHPQIPVQRITNVVMMGMGEPLLNFDAVVAALALMRDDYAYGLAKRRVTLSTAGVVPQIIQLAAHTDVALAISLHAPDDALRNQLVPLNKKYPIASLLEACNTYLAGHPEHKVTIEYVMLHQVNDSLLQARALGRLLAQLPCKINLIPFNHFPGSEYQCSPMPHIQEFAAVLMQMGYITTIRMPRGRQVMAACGMLAGAIQDRTKRQERFIAQLSEQEQAV